MQLELGTTLISNEDKSFRQIKPNSLPGISSNTVHISSVACRTHVIFLRFSFERRQVRSRSHAREEERLLKTKACMRTIFQALPAFMNAATFF